MTTYILISAILFFILGIIWNKKDIWNFLIKLILLIMSIGGLFYWAQEMGYIFQIPQ